MDDKKSKFSILSAKGSRSAVETTAQIIFTICSVVAVAAVFSITLYMIISGTPAIFKVGLLDILFGSVWAPTAATPSYGILYIILTSLIEEERPFQPPLLAHSRHEKTLLSSVWSGVTGQGQNLYVPGIIFGENLPCKPRWKG